MPLELPPFVYVMGPSGAGKDSLLRYARDRLQPQERIAFAHRYITRPVDPLGENHVALSVGEFEARRAAGLFVFHWTAHGTSYGIGVETEAWRRAGLTVVLNGSREHFAAIATGRPDILPLMITASPEALASRLAHRGREDRVAILNRLSRAVPSVPASEMRSIDNSGPLGDAGERFLAAVRAAAALPACA